MGKTGLDRIQQRMNQSIVMLVSGKLFLQFLVDAAASIEQWRLNWYRMHQGTLRTELYSGLHHIPEVQEISNNTTRMLWQYVVGLDIRISSSLSHVIQSGLKYSTC